MNEKQGSLYFLNFNALGNKGRTEDYELYYRNIHGIKSALNFCVNEL
jgi:hypothetical protein